LNEIPTNLITCLATVSTHYTHSTKLLWVWRLSVTNTQSTSVQTINTLCAQRHTAST